MNIKTFIVIVFLSGLYACSQEKVSFIPKEIPVLTPDFEKLSKKERMHFLNNKMGIDTLSDGTIKVYEVSEENISMYESLIQYPYYCISRTFDKRTGNLLFKGVLAPCYLAIGKSYYYNKTGKLEKEIDEEKGYKFRINQLLHFLDERGIDIPNSILDQYAVVDVESYSEPDSTRVGYLREIEKTIIDGKPCYKVNYFFYKFVPAPSIFRVASSKYLEINGMEGTILKEEYGGILHNDYDMSNPEVRKWVDEHDK